MRIKKYEQTSKISLIKATVLLLLRKDKVLLAMKKRGFGVDKWNGVGGKPNKGEKITDTAKRECEEEISVTPLNHKKVALFKYYFPHENFGMQVWIFTATEWQGKPIESEEMRPEWFKFKSIPYDQMWPDDRIWIPKVLEGKLLNGSFMFDKEGKILDFYLEEVNSIK